MAKGMTNRSEKILQGELENPRAAGGLEPSEVSVSLPRFRRRKIHLVQSIKELRTKLNSSESFGNQNVLGQRQIRGRLRGAAKNIPSRVSVTARLVRCECGDIEKLVDHVVAVAMRTDGIPYQIRPVESDSSE